MRNRIYQRKKLLELNHIWENYKPFDNGFLKEPNDIKKEPEPINENVPIKESVDEKEEKKSNGAHTPV